MTLPGIQQLVQEKQTQGETFHILEIVADKDVYKRQGDGCGYYFRKHELIDFLIGSCHNAEAYKGRTIE